VEIQIQHMSGSKAGLEQKFAPGTIRIGREQSNDVSFDPYRDILVSGRHAEITFDGGQWILRDLGSSNGTYVGEERVTIRPIRSGEIIQFGRGGPQLQLNITSPAAAHASAPVDNPGTRVMSINDLVQGNKTSGGNVMRPSSAAAADGTMMMTASDLQAARALAAPPPTSIGTRRPASPLRMVLIVAALAFFVGILGVIVLSPRKKPQTAATSTTAAGQAEVERLRQQLADATAQLAELQRARAENTDTGGDVTEDLERQYVKARTTIDALQLELERKNDEVRAAADKPAKVVVRYVPAPQPQVRQPAPESPAQIASRDEAPPIQETRSYDPPQALPVRDEAPAAPSLPAPAPPAVAEPAMRQPAKRAVAESTPVPALRTAPQPIATTRTAPLIPEPLPLRLAYLKRLRRRVVLSGVASEIPFPDAPRNLPTELAKSIGAALVSSSEFFVDRNTGSAVRVTPTLFRSTEKKTDSNAVVSTIKGLSGIFGSKTGSVPVPVRGQSVSYDTALAAQVTVESSAGRVLARSTPSSSLTDRRSSLTLIPAKTSWGDLLNRDSPQSDVFRSVIGQAVDEVMHALAAAEPEISIKGVRGQVVTLDAGRNANIAPDDVFDIVEGEQIIARVRVDSVQDATAVGRLLSGDANIAGRSVNYAGTDIGAEGSAIPQPSGRSATVRLQTEAREAPGTSFKSVTALRPGTRTTYLYSVGSWSKVKNGESAIWVPTSAIEVN
jgi:hypothetical protein